MDYTDFIVAFLFFWVSCTFIVLTWFVSPVLFYLFLLFSVLLDSQWKINLLLTEKYFRCDMKEGEILTEHLNPMKELTNQLGAIGAVIEEEDRIFNCHG